ncbi:endonuclease/exonuclease/phosphatase family protein [Alkaliflexus imshenetskii]|uniref:endonuclease/exonuclease/phosphatase family protein n=1 Tax=Alkaliflexus imshenetskii TaxID=286730 RepID=UPI000694E193|nr:endonuclease/exonuclease/phosphatase family protein [Alkaliflexus imshenetskii]
MCKRANHSHRVCAFYQLAVFGCLLFFTSIHLHTSAQTGAAKRDSTAGIMFYNVENLFDVVDDPKTNDDEFTPDGNRRWTYNRMRQKFSNLNRVILNAGGWNLPVVIGLCEVENSWVLSAWLRETGLYNLGYRYVHFDSPDSRGIDVAMLYRRERFKVYASRPVEVNFGPGERPTRDILYVKGVLDDADTLHVLVNHWPSRLGGAAASQPKRRHAATVVKNLADSIRNVNPDALLIVMGDFNEPPRSPIFLNDLKAGKLEDDVWLISPALYLPPGKGTLKHGHAWEVFDQILISRPFFEKKSPVQMNKPSMRIVEIPFLFQPDDVHGGTKLFRSYEGFKYTGGYSDHLPVWIDLIVCEVEE